MVVDTVEQGQACIEYLRSQQVGRASFIVLEKLRHSGMNQIQTPENVPRLFDLIKPKEPRFAAAFYKALTDTLVAENLDQANRIAFGGHKRWRVVTLAGQLIDSSGTMSGGGNSVQRGGMSSKLAAEAVPPEVIRQYLQESENDTRVLEEAQRQLRELESRVDELKRAGPQIDLAIEKVNLDIRNCSKRIADSEKIVKELKYGTLLHFTLQSSTDDPPGLRASQTRETFLGSLSSTKRSLPPLLSLRSTRRSLALSTRRSRRSRRRFLRSVVRGSFLRSPRSTASACTSTSRTMR